MAHGSVSIIVSCKYPTLDEHNVCLVDHSFNIKIYTFKGPSIPVS